MKRWKPKYGEEYATIATPYVYMLGLRIKWLIWQDTGRDYILYRNKLVFRTRKEAERELKKIRGVK